MNHMRTIGSRRISETSHSDVYAHNAPLRDPVGFAVPAVDADSALAQTLRKVD
jgi:hypothetical protein